MFAAIGDIHGYGMKFADLMLKLEQKVDFDATTFVFLGDYIDGGSDSKRVIEVLMQYQKQYPHWVFLMGNHEDMLLSTIGYSRSVCSSYIDNDLPLWYNQGGRETARSYFPNENTDFMSAAQFRNGFPKEHLEWMRNLPLHHETKDFVFVHAGLFPGKSAEETSNFSKLWIRDKFITSNYPWNKWIVFGHTYHRDPVVQINKIGIDTMHHGGGCLTAALLDVKDGSFFLEFVQSFRT